jgi:hypothetical protein
MVQRSALNGVWVVRVKNGSLQYMENRASQSLTYDFQGPGVCTKPKSEGPRNLSAKRPVSKEVSDPWQHYVSIGPQYMWGP